MNSKFFRILRERKLKKQYKKYYASLTSKDIEDEIRLQDEFKFSDREVEFLLKNEESTT